VAIFSVLVVTLFWLVANDLYRPRDAKRLFGFIGSGGILGGIVGSSIAAAGAQLVGTEHLLLLSAILLAGSWLVVQQLWALSPAQSGESGPQPAGHREKLMEHPFDFFRAIISSRYLLLLVALVGLTKIVSTLVYYQFNPFLEQAFPDADAKTTFTGLFFGGMNVAAFVIQFFFTSWVLRRWGLRTALASLPVGLFVGSTLFLAMPVFWVAAVVELFDGSMNYSLQQTTKEVLYLPIDRSVRYKVKPFIDMVVFRFGKGIAAIAGIVLLNVFSLEPKYLSYLSVPLIIVWLLVVVQLCRDYVVTIRTTLQARAALSRSRSQPAAAVSGPASAEWGIDGIELFGPLVSLPPSARKLALIQQLVTAQDGGSLHTKDLLSALSAYEAPLAHAATLGVVETSQLKAIIADPGKAMPSRRQAMRSLVRAADQATVDYLFGIVLVEADATLRHEAVLGLVKLRLRREQLEFPVQPIRRQIVSEVENYQRILSVASIYRRHHRGPVPGDDPVLALLTALLEESVEQTFRLLMLLYRPEDIHLVYEQMRAPDGYLRADALELLDNLIDPGMRSVLFPVLDEDQFLSSLKEDVQTAYEPAAAYRALQEAIWDHNQWLSVTTLCAVGRLRLGTMRQELERASRHHTAPLTSMAAKVALSLAATS